MQVPDQVRADLQYVFGWFPLESLEHLRENEHRLIRGDYRRGDKGCLFNLLSELLPAEQQIISRETLTRFFTGGSGHPFRELPEYQPARWLVRLIDGEQCARYRGYRELSWDDVIACLDQAIATRHAIEWESSLVARRAGAATIGQCHPSI